GRVSKQPDHYDRHFDHLLTHASLLRGTKTMNRHMWQRLLYSVAGLVVVAGVTYACKDFLDQPAQGTVDQATLMNKVGVEGSLIAAYRALDCESSSAGSWGCAASNWVWGGVTSNDAYKGSDLGDQNSIRGEALFLRAHYHFEAYRMWGHIPYYFESDSQQVAVGGYRKANDLPLDSIVKLIIADLSTAETLLPATPRNGEKGRVTK